MHLHDEVLPMADGALCECVDEEVGLCFMHAAVGHSTVVARYVISIAGQFYIYHIHLLSLQRLSLSNDWSVQQQQAIPSIIAFRCLSIRFAV